MTRKIIYALIGMTFLFSACENGISDGLSEVEISEENSTSFSIRSKESESTVKLRRTLTIFSEVLGKHAINSIQVRREINNLVRSQGNVINLDLFRDKIVLREIIIETQQRIIEDGDGIPLETEDPSIPGIVGDSVPIICLEIELPNASLSPGQSITTVAHPLTFANFNTGNEYSVGVATSLTTINTIVSSVTVDAEYVENNHNVIIARPARLGGECTFEVSADLDFTEFPSSL